MSRPAPVCWAMIPVKAPGEGKTRLAGVLGPAERTALVRAMLERVVDAAHECEAVARVFLAGAADHDLGGRVQLLDHGGEDLNRALSAALAQVTRGEPRHSSPPDRLIIAAGDLPQIDARDLAMLADVADGVIAIAPDRHGTGTNALSLPRSAFASYRFHFGPGSYARHRAEAARLGYSVETMLSDGLAKDIDEPADLADARGYLQDAR